MSWVTVVWSMIASACLTLAAIYVAVWYRNRTAWASLLFSVTALATAAVAFCELWMMRATSPGDFGAALRWAHVPLYLWLVALTWFVRVYLGAGRPWLAWAVCGLRTFLLLPNFLVGQNLQYQEITALRHIPFLGESIAIAEGVSSPWMVAGQLSSVVFLVFVADASVIAWRRGDRRKALTVGGSVALFALASMAQAQLVIWGGVQSPITISLFYLGLVTVMAYELSRDVLRASQLVHELQTSEAGLRESEERMSLAVDAANFGIWIRDLVRNDIWASDTWRALFGFGPSERVEFDGILQRLHPDDRDALRLAHALAIGGASAGSYQTEYRLILPDGTTRWIASQGRVECDATSRPVLVRGASRDVTARKLAEQETQHLRHEIAHVGRVSMMGQLAAALAHEINQPLGAILRNAEAAELFMQHPSPDLDEVRAILSDIRKDDQRAGAVIDRMRGLLKRHSLDTRPLDVRELVDGIAALVRIDAEVRQIRLDIDVAGDLPPVRGDRVHLQQVLLNLVLNGMDALNDATPEARRVSVSARLDTAHTIEFAVEDAGPGIPFSTLAHVFDPFFTTKPNGMGMGLPISRTIVEAHGGQLSAENNDGGGATFRFTLPIAEQAAGV